MEQINMIEKPIIFSTPMVQAIMQGRKTSTRRIIKGFDIRKIDVDYYFKTIKLEAGKEFEQWSHITKLKYWNPYGMPGDLLWVREAWCIDSRGANGDDPGYYYKADMPVFENGPQIWPSSWKSPLFMPKDAARIWLIINDIVVERLQDISLYEIKNEGMPVNWSDTCSSPLEWFQTLWEKINGAESWDANPWVWVIKFKVVSTSGKP